MEMIGRSLIRVGEVVFLISTLALASSSYRRNPGTSTAIPDPDRAGTYRIALAGTVQDDLTYDDVPSASVVLHIRHAVDPARRRFAATVTDFCGPPGREALSAETAEVAWPRSPPDPSVRLLGIPGVDGQPIQAFRGTKERHRGRSRGKDGYASNQAIGGPRGDGRLRFPQRAERFGPEPPSSGLNPTAISGVPGSLRGLRAQCVAVDRGRSCCNT